MVTPSGKASAKPETSRTPAASPPPSIPQSPPPQSPPPQTPAPQLAPPPPPSRPPQSGPPPAPERPTRPRPTRAVPPPQPVQAPQADPHPQLSKDPAERERQLLTVRGEANTILGLLGMVTARLTPTMPLMDEEKAAIQDPLEQVLFKYGGALPCEWQLAITLTLVALPRYPAFKEAREKAKQATGARS